MGSAPHLKGRMDLWLDFAKNLPADLMVRVAGLNEDTITISDSETVNLSYQPSGF